MRFPDETTTCVSGDHVRDFRASPIVAIQLSTITSFKRRSRFLAVLVTFLICVEGVALGQADVAHSTLKGNVTDQFGAAVQGANVTVARAGRGVTRSDAAGELGSYQ